jgi:hypothetical protein
MFFVCVVTEMLAGHQKNCASIPGRDKSYICLSRHLLAVGYSSRGMKLTTHPDLILKLKLSRAVPILPNIP